MLRSTLIFLLASFLLLVDAAPHARYPRSSVHILPRQEFLTGPRSFETVQTTTTQAGIVTLTCQITQTPIADAAGQQALIREEKTCSISVIPVGAPPPPGGGAPPPQPTVTEPPTITDSATSSATDPASATSTPISDVATTVVTDSGTTTATDSATATLTDTTSAVAPTDTAVTSGTDFTAIVTDSATGTGTDASVAPTPTSVSSNSSTATAGGSPSQTGTPTGSLTPDISPIGVSSVPAGSLPTTPVNGVPVTGTQAQAEADATATPFQLPGRKLEVLPIGLGVFAGISVIALIVVGLVTYERTKYRKAFRQRKLAESGAGLGYGGMAERA